MTGSSDVWHTWRKALGGPRMHHAWLLAGPRGSGKGAFALAAAAELVGARADAVARHHPDIIHLRREAKDAAEARKAEEGKPFELSRNITVAQIRTMQRRLATRPTTGDRRAIVIDPADDLEAGASNALLKTLEEPPDGTVFLLIAHQPARLLATIRSRCRVLRFSPTNDSDAEMPDEHAQIAATIDDMLQGRFAGVGGMDKFTLLAGNRPPRHKLQAMLHAAKSHLTTRAETVQGEEFARLDTTYAELCRLDAELGTYNYDPDLLAIRIGTLLSGTASPIDASDG